MKLQGGVIQNSARAGFVSLAGDGGVSLVILQSATSVVPHWQLHAGERTIFRCQSKAAKLSFSQPCTKATVDTESDHHT